MNSLAGCFSLVHWLLLLCSSQALFAFSLYHRSFLLSFPRPWPDRPCQPPTLPIVFILASLASCLQHSIAVPAAHSITSPTAV